MFSDLKYIVKNHFPCVLCSIIYFILGGIFLGGSLYSYILALVFYVVSIAIALSPVGEKLFRLMNGIRSLETNEEKEYINPIYVEVRRSVRRINAPIKGRIEICVIDKMHINACTIGKRTVAVTKGALKAFSEEQLKGVIAHEFGHICGHDTVANLFLYIGSGYLYLYILVSNLIIAGINKYFYLNNKERSMGKSLWSFVCNIFKAILFFSTLLIKITLAFESRKNEYEADKMAYQLGYGEELISALYLLEKMSLGDNSNFIQKMTASHPRTTARIGKLESYVSGRG